MAAEEPALDLRGVPTELVDEVEARVVEFEREHQASVDAEGPGWVPRIRSADYVIAAAVNVALIVWLILAMILG
jgi:hypothetical protein